MIEELSTYNFNPERIKKYYNSLEDNEKKMEYIKFLKTEYDSRKSKGIDPAPRLMGYDFSDKFLKLGIWIKNEYEHLLEIKKIEIHNTLKKKKTGSTDKIVWNKSRQTLESLFNDLHEEGYIGKPANIYEHFVLKSELLANKKLKGKKISKIRWLLGPAKLTFLIHYLYKKGTITFDRTRIHKVIIYHFCKPDGSDFDNRVLASSLNRVIDSLLDKKIDKKELYPMLKKIIDEHIYPQKFY